MKVILVYELPSTCVVLYLGNLTQENIQCEDRYLIKVLLAATTKAITRKWCKETLAGHY